MKSHYQPGVYLIVTVTLNAAVDKSYTVDDFTIDRMHRPSIEKTAAGGKGINVARMLGTLAREAIATGFIGGHNGDLILESLDTEGIRHDFVRTVGESRLCIAVVDPANVTQTEVNESGPLVTADEVSALLTKIRSLLPGASHLVLSGSAPPGVPDDFYAVAIEAAKSAGAITVLDSSGEHLRRGIAAAPDIIKPNAAELSSLVGSELNTTTEVLAAAKAFVDRGIGVVVVSMGRSGAIVTNGRETWLAVPPKIDFVSAVGSGDSLVAAFVDAAAGGSNLADAIAAGVAAGAGNAMTYGAACLTLECFNKLRPDVRVTRLE